MEPSQDQTIARRREQNRLAQRRFRWKQSQQKGANREPEREHRPRTGRSHESSRQKRNEDGPLNQLATLSPTNNGKEPFLVPDNISLSYGTEIGPGQKKFDITATTCVSAAQDTAMGMEVEIPLGDHAALNFTELDIFSSTSEAYGAGELIAPRSSGDSLGPTKEANKGGTNTINRENATLGGHDRQSVFGYQSPGDQALIPKQGSQSESSSASVISSSALYISKNAALPLPSPQSRQSSASRQTLDLDRGWLGPLHLAASKGHDHIVRMLLNRHHSVHEPDSDGLTALMYAVQGGFEDVARSLLNAGAAVDDDDRRGRTALHWAVLGRREALLRQLLEHGAMTGANLDVYDEEGRTPLHEAIDKGFEAAVQLLLEFDADLTCKAQKRYGERVT